MIASACLANQLWLFEDDRPDRPARRIARRPGCRSARPRVRPLGCSRFLPTFERFLMMESASPELRTLVGPEPESDQPVELTRRERIKIRDDLKRGRREVRRGMPKEARDLLRQDELSCEMLEMLDSWLGREDNARWTGWLDRWIAEESAKARALWSKAEERNRRTGLTADQLDPNEHVLPPICCLGRPGQEGGDE